MGKEVNVRAVCSGLLESNVTSTLKTALQVLANNAERNGLGLPNVFGDFARWSYKHHAAEMTGNSLVCYVSGEAEVRGTLDWKKCADADRMLATLADVFWAAGFTVVEAQVGALGGLYGSLQRWTRHFDNALGRMVGYPYSEHEDEYGRAIDDNGDVVHVDNLDTDWRGRPIGFDGLPVRDEYGRAYDCDGTPMGKKLLNPEWVYPI